MGDGAVDGVGCVLADVGEADVEAAFAEEDGGVKGGEAAKRMSKGGMGARGRRSRYCSSNMGMSVVDTMV